MAKIPPPKRGTKGAPPSVSETTGNLDINDSDELTPLNFKVPLDFHTDFKSYATRRRITMKRLLEESFREYEQNHPLGP